MRIQVVGPGCQRCMATEKNVIDACSELSLAADISHVYEIKEFAKLGVKLTPAVLVDDNVVVSGKVPTVNELKRIFSNIK